MSPSERAKETVTFRLRRREKMLLDHLARLTEKNRTDLFRELLEEKATALGVKEVPKPVVPPKPGRPKSGTKSVPSSPQAIPSEPTQVQRSAGKEASGSGILTVSDLAREFEDHFADRAEGTRRELSQTLRFILREPGVLDPYLPVARLDSATLRGLRETVKGMDLRFSKKNLHLTYLRMMLSFAVKKLGVTLEANPVEDLAAFTAKELADAWPGPRSID